MASSIKTTVFLCIFFAISSTQSIDPSTSSLTSTLQQFNSYIQQHYDCQPISYRYWKGTCQVMCSNDNIYIEDHCEANLKKHVMNTKIQPVEQYYSDNQNLQQVRQEEPSDVKYVQQDFNYDVIKGASITLLVFSSGFLLIQLIILAGYVMKNIAKR